LPVPDREWLSRTTAGEPGMEAAAPEKILLSGGGFKFQVPGSLRVTRN
jgi:hypothetical protein